MINLGKYNTLITTRQTDNGVYLRDETGEEVLLPNAYVPDDLEFEKEMKVFVYLDSEERPVATTLIPKAILGDFAYLQVKSISPYGAFLDWGVMKDLFVPFREQLKALHVGDYDIFHIYLDKETDRLAASTRLNRYIKKDPVTIKEGDEVRLLIGHTSDLGMNAIVNNLYSGLIYKNEIFKKIKTGDKINGFVKRIRPDGKIDLSVQAPSHKNIDNDARFILKKLEANDGFLPLHDKSDPDKIKDSLEMSKKAFKKAIGGLYKHKLITLEKGGIRLKKY